MSYLEPIEDKDLDLRHKLVEGEDINKEKEEISSAVERTVERKEGLAERGNSYSKVLSTVKSQKAADEEAVSQDAQAIFMAEGAEDKIEKLISLAEVKGVVHAVKVARHLNDNYALDEFHDRLLEEELHNALIKKGLIKEL